MTKKTKKRRKKVPTTGKKQKRKLSKSTIAKQRERFEYSFKVFMDPTVKPEAVMEALNTSIFTHKDGKVRTLSQNDKAAAFRALQKRNVIELNTKDNDNSVQTKGNIGFKLRDSIRIEATDIVSDPESKSGVKIIGVEE